MTRKKIWLGMLALALTFGMMVVGCGGEDAPTDGGTTYDPLPGTVTITGTPYVGQTLTANTDNLGGSGTISYQWKRGYLNINNATGKTYRLTDADLGETIGVYVTRPSHYIGKSSATIGPVTGGPPLTGTVSITGTPKVGQTLTVNTGSLGGSGTISYQWKRGNSAGAVNTNITNATESSYILSAEDYDKYVTISVTRSGHGGDVTSTAIGPVVDVMAWVQVNNTIFGTGNVNSVAYNGTNQWVAVGDRGILAYSGNGETWTKVDLSTSIFTSSSNPNSITGIAYGNGQWIAVGGYDGGKAASSVNGTAWTKIELSGGWVQHVAYGNNRWIIGGETGLMLTSTDDGVTWSSVTNPLSSVYSIAYGNNRWVAVGNNGSMATSTDGQNWTSVNVTSIFTEAGSTTVQNIRTVVYANNQWVVAGFRGIIATSTNGLNWTAVTDKPLSINTILSVAYGNNKWVAVSDSYAFGIMPSKIGVSPDGMNWTSIANTTFDDGAGIRSIAFGNNKWVAVGDSSKIAYANDN
jgi:hypothetical protein